MEKKSQTAEFKAKIALEALKKLKMINQIASENDIHPSLVSRWKLMAISNLHQIFAQKTEADKQRAEYEAEIGELYKQIGQLQVELNWIKKKYPR